MTDPDPDRMRRRAEALILELPSTHEGRNTWLLNHGTGPEAMRIRRGWIERVGPSFNPDDYMPLPDDGR